MENDGIECELVAKHVLTAMREMSSWEKLMACCLGVSLAHPAVGRQAVPLFVHLAVSIETDPDETERGLLDAIVRSDEDRALVFAHGARHVVIALQRRVIDNIAREHIQLHAMSQYRALEPYA